MITNISDAKASLSKLIELVLQGQEVIIGKAGKPVAKIVPYAADTAPHQLGAGNWKGKIWVADDFDENLPPHHTDPFDRMLVAQAQVEKLTLVTRDERLLDYGVPTVKA